MISKIILDIIFLFKNYLYKYKKVKLKLLYFIFNDLSLTFISIYIITLINLPYKN